MDKIKEKVPNTRLINATEIAGQCGNTRAANVVLVGVLAAVANLPIAEMENAIRRMVPEKLLISTKAFEEGMNIISNGVCRGELCSPPVSGIKPYICALSREQCKATCGRPRQSENYGLGLYGPTLYRLFTIFRAGGRLLALK